MVSIGMDLRHLDLNLLVVFDVMMAERHVTRAATRLNLTQSSVSNALRRLRDAFQDELFQKTPQGMEPTALARAMAPGIAQALDAVRATLDINRPFDPATATEAFCLGMSDYAEFVFGPRLVTLLAERAPGVGITIRHVDRENAFDLLDQDVVHAAVGVIPEPPSRMTRVFLLQEDFLVLMRPDHPAAGRPLDLDAYLAYPHLLISATASREGAVDRALAPLGRQRRLSVVASHLLIAGPMLRQSDLLCTMSRRVAEPLAEAFGLVLRPVPVEIRHTRISLAFHRRYEQHPAQIYLRRLIGEVARDLKNAS